MEVLVLSVKNFDFKDDNGERIVGNKVTYIVDDVIEGVEGYAPMIFNLDNDVAKSLEIVPAIYDFDFTMKTGRNNKPELVAKSISFISECNCLFTKKKVA